MKTTVSFYGPQGSGKTMLSRAFREFLSARGVLVTLLDPDDRRDAADNFSVEVETDDLLARLEALQAQPVIPGDAIENVAREIAIGCNLDPAAISPKAKEAGHEIPEWMFFIAAAQRAIAALNGRPS